MQLAVTAFGAHALVDAADLHVVMRQVEQAAELVRQRVSHVDLLAGAIAGAMLLLAGQDGARAEVDDDVAVLDRAGEQRLHLGVVDRRIGQQAHAGLLGGCRIGQSQARQHGSSQQAGARCTAVQGHLVHGDFSRWPL